MTPGPRIYIALDKPLAIYQPYQQLSLYQTRISHLHLAIITPKTPGIYRKLKGAIIHANLTVNLTPRSNLQTKLLDRLQLPED